MKMPVMFVALAAVMFALPLGAAPHASKHIHEEVDPYTGLKTLTLDVDTHGCPDDGPHGPYASQVKLLISAMQMAPHDVVYTMTTDLSYGRLLHPGKNGSMDTLTDGIAGQLYPVDAKVKWRERGPFKRRSHVRETIPFGLSLQYLEALSEAKMFEFRINGEDNRIQRCATGKQLHDLHEFLDAAATY